MVGYLKLLGSRKLELGAILGERRANEYARPASRHITLSSPEAAHWALASRTLEEERERCFVDHTFSSTSIELGIRVDC